MSEQSESASVSPAVIGWTIAAFVCSILMVNSSQVDTLGAGFFAKVLAVIPGTVFGPIGALLGGEIGRVMEIPILISLSGLVMGVGLGVVIIWG